MGHGRRSDRDVFGGIGEGVPDQRHAFEGAVAVGVVVGEEVPGVHVAAMGAATGHMGIWVAAGIAAYIAISVAGTWKPKSNDQRRTTNN